MNTTTNTIELSAGQGFNMVLSSEVMLNDERWNNLESALRLMGITVITVIIDIDTEYDIRIEDINEALEAAFYDKVATLNSLTVN
jgi:aspartate/methionine/tyrosine aminotransferase